MLSEMYGSVLIVEKTVVSGRDKELALFRESLD